jgi:cytochrome P450
MMGKLLTLVKGGSSRLDRQRMAGNLLTVFFAGTDATGSILSSMLWMIATDKSGLQDELAKEARDLGDIIAAAFQEINSKLPKLKSAAYETQRIYSVFPFLMLKAAQQVAFDNTTLSSGTQLLVMTRYVSTNPISRPTGVPLGPNGEHPSEFCARRWLVDGGVQPPSTKKGAFMAFGHGPRTCPGRDVAEIVTLVVISSVLQRFEISLAPGHATVHRKLSFAEVPDKDIHLILKPRKDI